MRRAIGHGGGAGSGAGGDRPAAAVTAGKHHWPVRSSLVAGITGFVAGAIAWHFIGFWSFVASVVLRGPEPPAAIPAPAADHPPRLARAAFRAVGAPRERIDPAHCSSAGLDRTSGSVTLGDCGSGATFAFRASGRRDRMATAPREAPRSSWIVEVNADREP